MGCGHGPDTGRSARALMVAVLVITPLAWSERALAAPSVTITSPGSAVVVTSDVLTVRAEVMSFYGLRSVRAAVETVAVDLLLSQPAAWAGTMNLSAVADGMRTLTVTATDVYGAVGMASTSIMLDRRPPADRPPTLTVRAPVDGRVAHRTIPVDFSCADDGPGGCASVQVILGATVVATAKDSLTTNVPAPSASDGQSIARRGRHRLQHPEPARDHRRALSHRRDRLRGLGAALPVLGDVAAAEVGRQHAGTRRPQGERRRLSPDHRRHPFSDRTTRSRSRRRPGRCGSRSGRRE
jgi:hypothetical protein